LPVGYFGNSFRDQRDGRSARTPSASRLPVWASLGLSLLLACLAVALRAPWTLAALAGVNLLYLVLCRVGCGLLRKAMRGLVWQTAILLGLHCLRFGAEGVYPALRVSSQLFLAFLPGMIFLASTGRSELVRLASGVLPPTGAFVLGASLHFVPLLVREVKGIYHAQVLRGARILPIDIFKPWCWPDWVGCLIVPSTVQALAMAGEIAMAARARDFGACRHRTCWPGNALRPDPEREP